MPKTKSNNETKAKKRGRKKKRVEFAEDRYEIRLSGSGGQGLITAGVILADAIAVGDGKNAAHTQSYGPEARGGRTRCDVIVSEDEIYFPEATNLDLLLALTQEAADAYAPLLKECGVLIVDEEAVKHKPNRPYVAAAFTKETVKMLGRAIATNIVALGFIAQYTGIVSKKSLENSVVTQFPTKFAENNKKALKLGFDLAKNATLVGGFGACEDNYETELDRT